MKWKETLKQMLLERGYVLALSVCLAAVAVSGWLFVRSLSAPAKEETPAPNDAVQAAVLPTLPRPQGLEEPPAEPVFPAGRTEPRTQPSEEAEESAAPSEALPGPGAVQCRPLEGTVILGYSMDKLAYNPTTRDWRTHPGVDIGAPAGTEVKAVAEGTVLAVFEDDLLGQTVTVEHAGGYVTHYANLNKEVPVTAGDRVQPGQTIGTVGTTALGEVGTESHLHFAVYRNNVPQDPEAYLAG